MEIFEKLITGKGKLLHFVTRLFGESIQETGWTQPEMMSFYMAGFGAPNLTWDSFLLPNLNFVPLLEKF